ncbi:MAG: 4Fe-4S binding protein [Polyangiaceae bacterium]|nr:4Fe-4S binding protein [Polyangiaceae bacterium]
MSLPRGGFAKTQCLHCMEPGCVSACPVGAMQKTAEGPVVYAREKCMGCRYCMLACPAGIPRYEWEKALPYVVKCDLCYPRVKRGSAPACVSACTNGALEFGERQVLLDRAHRRLAQGGARYLQHVYGEHDLGGTSVLYLANQPLTVLGWSDRVGEQALASFTWPLISKTPWMALGVGSLLVGTHLIIQRRMRIQAEQASRTTPSQTDSGSDGADASSDSDVSPRDGVEPPARKDEP